jgi:prevent-host-death family protein
MSAREAKNAFGLMIDTARAQPVLIEKHGRGVEAVVSVEEYERFFMQSGRVDKKEIWTKGASKGGQRSVRARQQVVCEGHSKAMHMLPPTWGRPWLHSSELTSPDDSRFTWMPN